MRRFEAGDAAGRPGPYRGGASRLGPDRGPGQPPYPPSRPPYRRPDAAPWQPQPPVASAEALEQGEELVAGRRPVEEAFAARRPAIRLLVTPQRRLALERIVLHATTLRIPIVEVEGGTLTALSGFDGHQGVALVVAARVFAGLDDILARAIERGEPAFVLVLDSLEDPQNLGTVLRSAEAAGVHGVIFPTARQAPLSPAAIKASAGATEHLLLCPVDDLAGALTDLHIRGLRIIGTEAEAPLTARQADLRGPIAIVIGSEGHGLAPAVRRRCDLFVRIPMRGAIGSLNAAVAGSVLLFEALGQRDPDARPTVPPGAATPAAEAAAPSDDAAVAPSGDPAVAPSGRRASTKSAGSAKAVKAAKGLTAATPTRTGKPGKAMPAGGAEPAVEAADAEPAADPTVPVTPVKRARVSRAKAAPVAGAAVATTDGSSAPPDAASEGDDLLPGAPGPSA